MPGRAGVRGAQPHHRAGGPRGGPASSVRPGALSARHLGDQGRDPASRPAGLRLLRGACRHHRPRPSAQPRRPAQLGELRGVLRAVQHPQGRSAARRNLAGRSDSRRLRPRGPRPVGYGWPTRQIRPGIPGCPTSPDPGPAELTRLWCLGGRSGVGCGRRARRCPYKSPIGADPRRGAVPTVRRVSTGSAPDGVSVFGGWRVLVGQLLLSGRFAPFYRRESTVRSRTHALHLLKRYRWPSPTRMRAMPGRYSRAGTHRHRRVVGKFSHSADGRTRVAMRVTSGRQASRRLVGSNGVASPARRTLCRCLTTL